MGKFKEMDIEKKENEIVTGAKQALDYVQDGCCGGGCHSTQKAFAVEDLSEEDFEAIKNAEWGGWSSLDALAYDIFEANKAKGFWDEAKTQIPFVDETGTIVHVEDFVPEKRNTGELIALMHSELSEALEASRKNLMDDKLPQYKGLHVELADALIRILDFCGAHEVPVGEIVKQKLDYNKTRPYKHGKLF